MKKINKTYLALAIVVTIALIAVPTGLVLAQEETPSDEQDQKRPMGPQINRKNSRGRSNDFLRGSNASLDRVYDRLVDRYEDMGYRIQDTDDVTQRLEDRIEDLVEQGEDPAEIEAILETFENNMSLVEEAYAEVGSLIDAHEGFDDEGEVADEELALATLRYIAEGLLDVHQLGEGVRFDLRWDLMEFDYRNNPDDD